MAAVLLPAVFSGRPPAHGQASPNRILYRLLPDLPVFDVRKYGAKADDGADDTAAIQAAAAAAGAAKGTVFIPAGVFNYTGTTLSVPSDVAIVGKGSTEIRVQAGRTTPVFDVDGKSNVRISDLRITKASGANTGGTAYGVFVRGNSADVLIERVLADGFVSGVYVAGADGTTPGTARRLTFRDVTCNNSTGSFLMLCPAAKARHCRRSACPRRGGRCAVSSACCTIGVRVAPLRRLNARTL